MRRGTALPVAICAVLLAIWLVGSTGGRADVPRTEPPRVMIHEVEYDSPQPSVDSNWEWVELYNATAAAVDLAGWSLSDNTGSDSLPPLILPAGAVVVVAARASFYDNYPSFAGTLVVLDGPLGGGLNNTGDRLILKDAAGTVIDALSYGDDGSILACAGQPCGGVLPGHSLEREPGGTDTDQAADWADRFPPTPGLVAGQPPGQGADLRLVKSGPAVARLGQVVTYTLSVSNAGPLPAAGTRLTDVLPAGLAFEAHDAPYPLDQPQAGTLVWDLGTVTAPLTLTVAARVAHAAGALLTNTARVTCTTAEANPADNQALAVTRLAGAVLVDALYYDGYAAYDDDEAVRLVNVTAGPVDLCGWRLAADDGPGGASLPAGTQLPAGGRLWCARQATAFERQFGFKPDLETEDSDPAVPEMAGAWPRLANDGGRCLLWDAGGGLADSVVYEAGDPATPGWSGGAVWPWSPNNYFGAEGQILYRRRDEASGLPLADGDTAADWAQDPADALHGRRVLYPGWDLDTFFQTARITETAVLTVAVGPDHLYETVRAAIAGARHSIWIETYTFESAALAAALLERRAAGVEVMVLLEGAPVGGAAEAQRWICGQLQAAGAQVWFMRSGEAPARYRFQHAKFLLIDGRLALVSSENLNPTGMPADDKANGTAGRRGLLLATDAPGVVAHLKSIFQADLDPGQHLDLATCAGLPALCSGLPPLVEPDWTSYTVAFTTPLVVQGELAFEVVQSPDNSQRASDALLGLLARAGAGDTVLVEQFDEQAHWGPAGGSPSTDPNPRLVAYLDAARRGARVRVLLNGHAFGAEQTENAETTAYLQAVARGEGLDVQARLGDPTLLGLHNKMVLVRTGGQGVVHAGSLNGSEVAAKANREVALQVRSTAAYDYLAALFEHDWNSVRWHAYLPAAILNHQPPLPAGHLLVSELFYAVAKEEEWVEILNPTPAVVALSTFKVGDAESPTAYEGMYRFPLGASIGPQAVVVVAASAASFRQAYGRAPDYEFYATDPAVPDMAPHAWGEGEWHLSNSGDQVLLLDANDRVVDVLAYGGAFYPGVSPHPGVSLGSHSLERYPALFDTDDCALDFRDWPFPNPGQWPR